MKEGWGIKGRGGAAATSLSSSLQRHLSRWRHSSPFCRWSSRAPLYLFLSSLPIHQLGQQHHQAGAPSPLFLLCDINANQILVKSDPASCSSAYIGRTIKGVTRGEGISIFSGEQVRWYTNSRNRSNQFDKYNGNHQVAPYLVRAFASNYSTQSSKGTPKEETRKDISTVEDPFDAPTYNIPEKPVTFTEGASYSVIILAGLGVAALAAYAVFKELIFEPKEYKIFGQALKRVQNDSQVTVRVGSPVTGYGSESRNRAARQRIPNRVWTDEDGVEHVEVNFYIRGPHGAGKVYTEMFKDQADKKWKFTYLIVEITSPSRAQLMLESYVPA